MELLAELTNNPIVLYFPVALVFVIASLLYTFGFKSAPQPPFDKIASIGDERKLASKKRKSKEKKPTANGHITHQEPKSEKSPAKEKEQKKSPAKETPELTPKEKKVEKPKKAEVAKPKKEQPIENAKNKKDKIKVVSEKPSDYDDGNWETVPTKADKKKKQDSPAKKDKKKKAEKPVELKEVVNNEVEEVKEEIKEVEKEEIKVEPEVQVEKVIEVEEIQEVKKDKKKEKKVKKEKKPVEKSVEVEEVKQLPVAAQIEEAMSEPAVAPATAAPAKKEGAVAFDELGDTWTEAKQPKKSKKKARRDN